MENFDIEKLRVVLVERQLQIRRVEATEKEEKIVFQRNILPESVGPGLNPVPVVDDARNIF